MNIIIPIGGIGKRFSDDGYLSPKPLIRFLGQPMIFWIIENLKLEKDDTIHIVYHHDLKNYNFKDQIKNKFPLLDIKFIELYYQTEGAVETLLFALKTLDDPSKKVISLDCDTFYTYDVLSTYREIKENCVFYFEDLQDKPIYSYISFENEKNILEKEKTQNKENKKINSIKEKQRISSHANTGCYCFQNGKTLIDYCQQLLDQSKSSLDVSEYYTSSVIKLMLKAEEPFVGHQIEQSDFVCLGTPHLLKIQSQNVKQVVRRFCFDIDHTLVSAVVPGDYANVKPVLRNINLLKYLKSQGHTIILYTARRMKTFNGNVGQVVQDIAKITFETLEKYEIEYDEIYFGKPYADYYLDDLAINAYHDLEKELGYYQLLIPERDHHDLKMNSETVKKTGKVEGEIFWYQHIHQDLHDLFPKLISCDSDASSYEIERIDGVTLSRYYLNGNLTTTIFNEFLKVIEKIHNSVSTEEKHSGQQSNLAAIGSINKYENYVNKLDQRYENYDYSKFENSSEIYKKLRNLLQQYEKRDNGELYVIHGDPVFTNVILTKFMNFKLIDMRGLQGDVLTLYGDILYDYAKIYQSLIGYDEILLDQKVNPDYRDELINYYENYLSEKFSVEIMNDIKIITASLLFTLIPLHDNVKCQQYYNLINRLI